MSDIKPLVGKCRHHIYDCSDCNYEQWLREQKKSGWRLSRDKSYIYKEVIASDGEDKPKLEHE